MPLLVVDDNVSVELCGEAVLLANVVTSQLVDELHELSPELQIAAVAIDEVADVLEADDVEEEDDDVEELLRRLFAGLGCCCCACATTVVPVPVRATLVGLCTTVLLLCSLELLVHAAFECSDSSSSPSSSGLPGVGGLNVCPFVNAVLLAGMLLVLLASLQLPFSRFATVDVVVVHILTTPPPFNVAHLAPPFIL